MDTVQDKKINLLLVDDDKFLLDMYSVKFKSKGVDIVTSKSASDALTKIKNGFLPDIILLDIIMPSMDGLDFLSNLKNENLTNNAVVIILSNQADDEDRAKLLGADGFIVKASLIPSEVVDKVLNIYENNKK